MQHQQRLAVGIRSEGNKVNAHDAGSVKTR